ncbi:hypothetical protein F3Y22_tig00116997pilonHSYRG01038 [Hibiscus syriacus]|uniref:Uncharacterized protein n=1 Tax=Hibiscus syriacus TaxID=106335 RepID=A0A6A2WGV6_HIBSY|nr:hypothetical protein F3Y22_tig00116997pilonHSYRG01038 [Hibiscus syriacus]
MWPSRQGTISKERSINRVESGDTEEKVAPTAGLDSVEDDGAKTVEAIEDTIVFSVSSSVQPEQSPEAKADATKETMLSSISKNQRFQDEGGITMLQNTIRWRKQFGIDERWNKIWVMT